MGLFLKPDRLDEKLNRSAKFIYDFKWMMTLNMRNPCFKTDSQNSASIRHENMFSSFRAYVSSQKSKKAFWNVENTSSFLYPWKESKQQSNLYFKNYRNWMVKLSKVDSQGNYLAVSHIHSLIFLFNSYKPTRFK